MFAAQESHVCAVAKAKYVSKAKTFDAVALPAQAEAALPAQSEAALPAQHPEQQQVPD